NPLGIMNHRRGRRRILPGRSMKMMIEHRERFAIETPTDAADIDRQLVLMQNGRLGAGIRSHAGGARETRAKANKAILEGRHPIVGEPIHDFREPLSGGGRWQKRWI